MQEFIRAYGNDGAAGDLVVQAYWRIAQSWKARGRMGDYRSALNDVTTAYERTGQPAASIAAGYAAEARFHPRPDSKLASFANFQIKPGKPKTVEAYINTITKQMSSGSTQAQSVANGYEPIFGYRRPRWTIASYVRQGRAYEILARSILNAPVVIPTDLERVLRKAHEDEREEYQLDFEDKVRQVLDAQVRPVECFAVARYALAARAGRAGSFDDEYTRLAIDWLQAYGDERIAECIAEAQASDATFQGYTPGEFRALAKRQTAGDSTRNRPTCYQKGERLMRIWLQTAAVIAAMLFASYGCKGSPASEPVGLEFGSGWQHLPEAIGREPRWMGQCPSKSRALGGQRRRSSAAGRLARRCLRRPRKPSTKG